LLVAAGGTGFVVVGELVEVVVGMDIPILVVVELLL
jgi:hypothetical protein